MMEAVKAALRRRGVPEAQIHKEAFGTVKRDPKAIGEVSTEVAANVIFQASDTTAPVGSTVLDAADAAGVFIDNACRAGTCASCRVKLMCEHGRRGCAHQRGQGSRLYSGMPGRDQGRCKGRRLLSESKLLGATVSGPSVWRSA